MSTENVKKLELGINMSCGLKEFEKIDNLSEVQKLLTDGCTLEDEAMQSGDVDVLERAFDYFLEESADNGLGNGGCESLESEIFQYFSWDQIFKILKLKLSKLIELNIDRALNFACACNIKEIEELACTLPLAEANAFLVELKNSCREDLADQIKNLQKELNNRQEDLNEKQVKPSKQR